MSAQRTAARLTLDQLRDPGDPVEVRWLRGLDVDREQAREPHRHDYHELLWVRSGSGRHLLDGRPVAVRPGTVTVIGRGQVHVFECARGVQGAIVRFGDELILAGAGRSAPEWLLAGRGGRTVAVPAGEADRLEGVIGALRAEADRPPDARTAELQGHLIDVILLWIERWYDEARIERPEAGDEDIQLHRRFARLLEADFARNHDAAHYADALRVPPAALSRALAGVTGRSTKELVTDRVMLEAARLLRFTDLTVGEIAFQTGFGDPLYFSRAFKRHHGEAPMAYRDRVRGKSMDR
jgi:AraC family transcriptional regulator, transcriptional activator of pobA